MKRRKRNSHKKDDFKIKLAKMVISSLIKYAFRLDLARKTKRLYFSELTKQLTLIAQGFRCKMCGRFLDVVDFHHIDGNRSINHITNCEAICPNCHAKITRQK